MILKIYNFKKDAIMLIIFISLFILRFGNFASSEGSNLNIEYIVAPDSSAINYIFIQVFCHPTGGLPNVTNENVEYAKWHLEKNDREIKSGDLKFIYENYFESDQISLKWLGSGTYSIWIEIKFMGNITSTESLKNEPNHKITRSAPLEDFLWITLIIVSIIVIVIIIAIFISRRGLRQEEKRLKSGLIEKPVEIIDISKSNIQKIQKQSEKKQKGKTQVSTDLIFSVPQWEEEDLEAVSEQIGVPPESLTQPKIEQKKEIYTLHCASCNNWYEIDEYIESECPNCKTKLMIALYCNKCNKWFDVPKLGTYQCPKCSNKLQYFE